MKKAKKSRTPRRVVFVRVLAGLCAALIALSAIALAFYSFTAT